VREEGGQGGESSPQLVTSYFEVLSRRRSLACQAIPINNTVDEQGLKIFDKTAFSILAFGKPTKSSFPIYMRFNI